MSKKSKSLSLKEFIEKAPGSVPIEQRLPHKPGEKAPIRADNIDTAFSRLGVQDRDRQSDHLSGYDRSGYDRSGYERSYNRDVYEYRGIDPDSYDRRASQRTYYVSDGYDRNTDYPLQYSNRYGDEGYDRAHSRESHSRESRESHSRESYGYSNRQPRGDTEYAPYDARPPSRPYEDRGGYPHSSDPAPRHGSYGDHYNGHSPSRGGHGSGEHTALPPRPSSQRSDEYGGGLARWGDDPKATSSPGGYPLSSSRSGDYASPPRFAGALRGEVGGYGELYQAVPLPPPGPPPHRSSVGHAQPPAGTSRAQITLNHQAYARAHVADAWDEAAAAKARRADSRGTAEANGGATAAVPTTRNALPQRAMPSQPPPPPRCAPSAPAPASGSVSLLPHGAPKLNLKPLPQLQPQPQRQQEPSSAPSSLKPRAQLAPASSSGSGSWRGNGVNGGGSSDRGTPSPVLGDGPVRPKLSLEPRTRPLPETDPWHSTGDAGGLGGGPQRPRLHLAPPKPVGRGESSKSSIFGAARPREEVLVERGIDPVVAALSLERPPASTFAEPRAGSHSIGIGSGGAAAPREEWQTVTGRRQSRRVGDADYDLGPDPFAGDGTMPRGSYERGYGGYGSPPSKGLADLDGFGHNERDLGGFPGRRGLPTRNDDFLF